MWCVNKTENQHVRGAMHIYLIFILLYKTNTWSTNPLQPDLGATLGEACYGVTGPARITIYRNDEICDDIFIDCCMKATWLFSYPNWCNCQNYGSKDMGDGKETVFMAWSLMERRMRLAGVVLSWARERFSFNLYLKGLTTNSIWIPPWAIDCLTSILQVEVFLG
jgi:hypothetical protein